MKDRIVDFLGRLVRRGIFAAGMWLVSKGVLDKEAADAAAEAVASGVEPIVAGLITMAISIALSQFKDRIPKFLGGAK